MHQRSPLAPGPSSKTWPGSPPQRAHTTSVRVMKCERSSRVSTASENIGSVKLGHPVPDSNFVSELNSALPHPPQRWPPSPFSLTYLPVNGGSVAALRRTSYWSASSSARHSCSLFWTFSVFSMSLLSVRFPHTLRRPRLAVRRAGYLGPVPSLPFVAAGSRLSSGGDRA